MTDQTKKMQRGRRKYEIREGRKVDSNEQPGGKLGRVEKREEKEREEGEEEEAKNERVEVAVDV